MNQYSYGAFIMMSIVPEGNPGVAVHFDGTFSEDWNVSQDVPSYAVAQRQVHSQRIRGNTTFRAELAVSETPLEPVPRLVPWYRPDDQPDVVPESYLIYPDTRLGEDRVTSVWQALEDNLDARWDLHTTRHGFLGSMVLTAVEKSVGSAKRESRFRLTFQRFEVTNVSTIKVQRAVRAKKGGAKKTTAPEWTCEETPWYLQSDGQTLQATDTRESTILRSRLDNAKKLEALKAKLNIK